MIGCVILCVLIMEKIMISVNALPVKLQYGNIVKIYDRNSAVEVYDLLQYDENNDVTVLLDTDNVYLFSLYDICKLLGFDVSDALIVLCDDKVKDSLQEDYDLYLDIYDVCVLMHKYISLDSQVKYVKDWFVQKAIPDLVNKRN